MAEERRWGDFAISTDPARIDVALVHGFLTRAYWSEGIPVEVVARSLAGSLAFDIYHVGLEGERQVGLARVISDRATFAYLADVFGLEEFRGRGLSKWLLATILAHPELQGLRRWLLATADAHGLYRQFGFAVLAEPGKYLTKAFPGIYKRMGDSDGASGR